MSFSEEAGFQSEPPRVSLHSQRFAGAFRRQFRFRRIRHLQRDRNAFALKYVRLQKLNRFLVFLTQGKGISVSLSQQIVNFQGVSRRLRIRIGGREADRFLSKSLFSVNSGSNDLVVFYARNGRLTQKQQDVFIRKLTNQFKKQLQALPLSLSKLSIHVSCNIHVWIFLIMADSLQPRGKKVLGVWLISHWLPPYSAVGL